MLKPSENQPNEANAEDLIKDLARRDSSDLQRATDEALAFIGYLRRFAQKGTDA